MIDKVTLILILHNRHKNLDRLLEYYDEYNFPILIADSSVQEHQFTKKKSNWTYSYTPGVSFPKKIEIVLAQVTTPYVVMCADDDFIIPKSILACVSFLEENKDYAIAQGLSIRYEKESLARGNIELGAIYGHIKCIEPDEPLQRLYNMFENYRAVVYAVFRTYVLQQSYQGAGSQIKNLFLNEYITAFIPILYGKCKEIPILYQVREYALDSDDKTAIDIDALLREKQYANEVNVFKSFISTKMAAILMISHKKAEDIVDKIIQDFASKIHIARTTISPKKRIGNLIRHLPIVGPWMIQKNRSIENAKRLNAYIDIHKEKKEIDVVSKLLIKYNK
ncbi:TIGR00180 family glycosyltransferase [Ilyomonas limi]|uniref:TIGR00180 family glycosyltransferase n=1 Tax=Ilyomonas limi TaxID=2575867 RepID=A0A4U3L210_9BACT|nr:TIGR00180 family glycosyltransferase [Ilyomonas limi]TKK68920.1 TIGR00180 family glycosyltransferase [Ilyomonas limi]